jgi:hypothetical protein
VSLFHAQKPTTLTAPNPDDLANRANTERRQRLASGGSQSTLLAKAMAQASGQPTATLTGVS